MSTDGVTTSTSFLIVGTSRQASGITADQVVECIDYYLRNDASAQFADTGFIRTCFADSTIGPAQLTGNEGKKYSHMTHVIARLLGDDSVFEKDTYTVDAVVAEDQSSNATIFSKPSDLKLPAIKLDETLDEFGIEIGPSLEIPIDDVKMHLEAIVFAFVLLSIVATRQDPSDVGQPFTKFEFSKNLPNTPRNEYTNLSTTENNVYNNGGENADVSYLQSKSELRLKAIDFVNAATKRSLYVFKQIKQSTDDAKMAFLSDAIAEDPSNKSLFRVNMDNIDVDALATTNRLRVKPTEGFALSNLITLDPDWSEYYRLALITNLDLPKAP